MNCEGSGFPGSAERARAYFAFIAAVVIGWTALLTVSPGGRTTAQVASNIGLIAAAFTGSSAALLLSRRAPDS